MCLGNMALTKRSEGTLIGCVGFARGTGGGGDFEVGHKVVVLEGETIGGCIEDGEGEVLDADIECKDRHA
jgi:hypothetical protein